MNMLWWSRTAPRVLPRAAQLATAVVLLLSAPRLALAAPADDLIRSLSQALPGSVADCTGERAATVAKLAAEIELAVARSAGLGGLTRPLEFVARVDELHAQHAAVERLVETMFSRRTLFASEADTPALREQLRAYLRITAATIDLAARLRYTLLDATRDAAYELEPQSPELHELLAVLTKHRSSIGALAVIDELFIPPASRLPRAVASAHETKKKVLKLIASTRHADLVAPVARFMREPTTTAELVVASAATIYALGLPQMPRPDTEPGLPPPPILPDEMADRLAAQPAARLPDKMRSERDQWVKFFRSRATRGLSEEKYQLGESEVRPGDWLLMRNPSPYNRFTDLAPGLFTHVGVVTSETAPDGIRRMVLVDIPERGQQIRPVCLDMYVQRTLHYVLLRHPDSQVAAAMAEAARQMIGNRSQFDLNFRTDRIAELRGESLAGKTIHTYCAGLLLICAQQTAAPRSDFFPIEEFAAGGKTAENLATLGLSFGEHFVSPTGALFSPKLELIGQRPPMYNPRRDVIDRVYDHFAMQLAAKKLTPSPDLYQSLRLKLAEAGRANPLLGKALAEALDVNENLDLVSAAKAAAVVETLDEVAESAGTQYEQALAAVRVESDAELAELKLSESELKTYRALRQQHAELAARWEAATISPRGLRIALVNYYAEEGQRELDRRFFEE